MAYDAFTGGVEPGGLRSKDEIRILLCYLLASVPAPLSRDDILTIMQENGFANYFEVTDSLSELEENGNVLRTPGQPPLYTVAEQGRMIARQLHMDLPLSVREKAVAAALSLLALARSKRENKVEVEEIEEGFIVTCHISGGEVELMRFSLYAPDRYQANLIEQSFHRSPQTVYQVMLALMTSHENQISGLLAKRNAEA